MYGLLYLPCPRCKSPPSAISISHNSPRNRAGASQENDR